MSLCPTSHKTVIILDESNYFLETSCEQTFDFDVVNKSRQPSGIIPLSPIGKSLWTCSVEAVAEYCRIVWDIYPSGERLIQFVVCGSDSAANCNDWNSDDQNLQKCMEWMAKSGSMAHLKAKHQKRAERSQILNGFHKAIESLSVSTHLQDYHRNGDSSAALPNGGRIVCISSFRNDSHIKSVEDSVKELITERNELILKQRKVDPKCQLLTTTFCELVFINTFPIEDQSTTSKIIEIPRHQLNSFISSEVYSVKSGRFLASKLSALVLNHYELASTTVTGIPMKEEQNASSSANYDVEILHSNKAHSDSFRSGLINNEDVCMQTSNDYHTIKLRWITPRTNALELHYCTTAHRITSVDVNSRPASCLTNFLLSGRTVMLEMPRLKGKIMSHMLSSHCGELYIHTLGTSRSILEDPPSISEGSGGRVTDYRINDFGEMMKRNRLVACRPIHGSNKEIIEKAKHSLAKQTIYWPLVIGNTILFNIQIQIQNFLNLVPKEYLTEEEVMECKKSIYHLVGMESKGTNLPVPTIGIKGKGPKREELYRMLWNEIEYFVRSHCVTPEHKSILNCLLECRSKPDPHSTASAVRTATTADTTADESTKSQTNGTKSGETEWKDSLAWRENYEWARNELQLMETQNTDKTPEPALKKFKSNGVEPSNKTPSMASQSLLNIWTNKLNEENNKKRDFVGRNATVAKLYVNLNDNKNENQ